MSLLGTKPCRLVEFSGLIPRRGNARFDRRKHERLLKQGSSFSK